MTSSPPAKRLTRSTSDHMVAGVAGGLGSSFGLDPLLFRIAFGISVFFGGLGLLAYVMLAAFVPYDDGRPSFMDARSRPTTIAVAVLAAVCAVTVLGPPAFVLGPGLLALAVLGLLTVLLYRAFGGHRGDDAAQVIARGTLVLLVLIACLGAATGVGFVAAIGGGAAVAVIAIAACVTTDAQIGAGQADLVNGEAHGGIDVTVDRKVGETSAPVVRVNADIGVGHLQIEPDGFEKAPVCA